MKFRFNVMLLFYALIILSGCAASGYERGSPKQDISSSPAKTPKMRIAVIGFDVHAYHYGVERIADRAEEMLTVALLKTGHFDLVERRHIKRVLEEQKFQYSGMVDPITAVKLGKILGVQAIVTGAVTEIGFSSASFIVNIPSCRASIDVRVIDVETAKVIAAETGDGRSSATIGGDVRSALGKKDAELWISEALRKASEDAAYKIAINMANVR
jgi:curli biogenesis system outer membrane secretion channel CsgG